MRALLALVALSAALFFVGLSAYDLDTKAEPREGVTAWEMIHSGDWLLPRLNGQDLPEKPLVFPWLVAGSMLALGEGGELAPRLPSALMGCLLVLIVHALGRRLQGDGIRPAVICATMFLVVSLARRARVDMTLAVFVAFALLQLLRALERPRASTIGLFWLSLALGTLTKGPVGAVLPLLTAGTFLVSRGRLRELRLFLPMSWVFVLVAGSWYAHGLLRSGGEFSYRSFMMENVLMFVGAERGGGHIHGTFYYLQYLPLHTAPWCIYLPAALWLAWKRRDETANAFVLSWAASLFVFFSIARGKRGDYMLPLMPAFALMVAQLWRDRYTDILLRWSSSVGLFVTPAALLAYPFVRHRIPFTVDVPLFASAAVLVAVVPALLLAYARRRAALATIAGGVTVLSIGVSVSVMPQTQRTRPFVDEVGRIVSGAPLVQRGVIDFSSSYYLRRRIPTVERDELERTLERGGYALVSQEEWRTLPLSLRGQVAAMTSDRILVGRKRP